MSFLSVFEFGSICEKHHWYCYYYDEDVGNGADQRFHNFRFRSVHDDKYLDNDESWLVDHRTDLTLRTLETSDERIVRYECLVKKVKKVVKVFFGR